jgi:uncharacterized protein
MDLEYSSHMVPFEEKSMSEDDDCWTFAGYAAVFGNRDGGGDIIMPGAFTKSLKSHGLPDLHIEHKSNETPVGTITDAFEDKIGLRVEGVLPKDLPEARAVHALLKPRGKMGTRALKGMSIGFRTLEFQRGTHEGKSTRYLKELLCREASFVKDPMNKLARVDSLKSDIIRIGIDEFKSLSDREREAHFRTLGHSDSLSKYLTACTRDASLSSKAQREAGSAGALPDFAASIRNFAQRL